MRPPRGTTIRRYSVPITVTMCGMIRYDTMMSDDDLTCMRLKTNSKLPVLFNLAHAAELKQETREVKES